MKVGDLKGGANHVYTTGPYPDRDGIFILYEWPSGGTGASLDCDGNHATRQYNEGDFNSLHSSEVVESQYPLRVERTELRVGGCGDGTFRGGLGLRRDLRLLGGGGALSVLTDKCRMPPVGVHGGANGAANNFVVVRDGAVVEPSPIPGKVSAFPLRRGDIVRYETAGGGGYGDPLLRDPDRVAGDVRLGYLTPHMADIRYGVVLGPDGAVDGAATARRRADLRAARVTVTLAAAPGDEFEGTRRLLRLSGDLAARLGVAPGDLVEVVAGTGPLVRGWVAPETGAAADGGAAVLRVGPGALALLAAEAGAAAEIRTVRREPEA
jgi:N-methylhydantoinase B